MSSIVNKVKDTLSGSNSNSNNNSHTTTHDPHHTHPAGTTGTASHPTTTTTTGAMGTTSTNPTTTTTGVPGTHTETVKTGPVHNNPTLNKVDPRVHEHKTTTGTSAGAPLDPTNASHVPPSVMQQHLGEPTIEHDFPHDSKHKRHSVSHQENHLMK